jgi:glycosyltransferase involved in cell wall biosynthesis
MPKKIIFCNNAYPPNFIGGAELVAHNQAKTFKKLGHEVMVFTGDITSHGKRHSIRQERYDGIPVQRVHLTPQDYDPNFLNFHHPDIDGYFEVLLDRFMPDCVHFHHLLGLSMNIIHLAQRRGIPTFLTVHDHWAICCRSVLIKPGNTICERFHECWACQALIPDKDRLNIPVRMRIDFMSHVLDDVDRFIFPSHYLAGVYRKAGFPKEKLSVIWNGTDVNRFKKIRRKKRRDKLRFTFIGHLGQHKGVDVLIEAAALLAGRNRSFEVNIVGRGEMESALRQRTQELNLGDTLKFWGRVDNRSIKKVYQQTDILVLPSVCPENQPVTIVEAMTAGIPIIASRIGGIPELVQHEHTGLLFEAGNPDALAECMIKMISSPNQRVQFSRAAAVTMKDNSYKNQVAKIIKLYNNGCSEVSRPSQKLVLCVGRQVNRKCAELMNLFLREQLYSDVRFIMTDWLYADQQENVVALWVVDAVSTATDLRECLRNRYPLLVPAFNKELKNLCLNFNCGLYYRDMIEAEACLKYLLENPQTAKKLGQNSPSVFK